MIIQYYQDEGGIEPFKKWLDSLRSAEVQSRVYARLDRVQLGNLGDYEPVGNGVYELRLHFGPGYRIYFGRIGKQIILLLAGGIKKSQVKDIREAKQFWGQYKD